MTIRLASRNPFPYGYPKRVCYFTLVDGVPNQLTTRAEIRDAVKDAIKHGTSHQIYAVWPGEWSSDLFVIDDPTLLAAKVGVDA
jgi:hypothetical protein